MTDITLYRVDSTRLDLQVKAVERAIDRAETAQDRTLLREAQDLLAAMLDRVGEIDFAIDLHAKSMRPLDAKLEKLTVLKQHREGLENPALQQTLTPEGEILDGGFRAEVERHLEEHHDD